MIDKQEWYDKRAGEMAVLMKGYTEYLMQYPDSRYRSQALTKLEECYLWFTQILHAEMLELEEKAEPTVDELRKSAEA